MSGISSTEGSWREPASGRNFHYHCWHPNPLPARALLIVLHGFGEHGARYQPFAEVLAAQGIAVAVPDLWGHGRSGGRRGDLGDVRICVRQVQAMTERVFFPAYGQQRYALFGHSFGGLAAICWALDRPSGLQRLVVQSPLLEAGFPIPRWKRTGASLLAAWWPTFTFSMKLDVSGLSHDPAVVEAYRRDPLVHGAMSARTYHSLLRTRDDVLARSAELRVPVLMLYGDADRIVSTDAAHRWFDRLTCEKRSAVFPGSYHELHHEPARDGVVQMVRDWVLVHD